MIAVVAVAALAADGGASFAEATKPAVVHLSGGTGFFVSPEGLVVTTHTVMMKSASGKVQLFDGGTARVAGILADDPERDVTLLLVEGSGFPALALDEAPADPHALYAVVTTADGQWAAIEAPVLETMMQPDAGRILRFDDPDLQHAEDQLAQPHVAVDLGQLGISGAPLVGPSGVVAMARDSVGFRPPGQGGITVGVAAATIREAVEKLTGTGATADASRLRNLGISAAFFLGLAGWWVYRSRTTRRGY